MPFIVTRADFPAPLFKTKFTYGLGTLLTYININTIAHAIRPVSFTCTYGAFFDR